MLPKNISSVSKSASPAATNNANETQWIDSHCHLDMIKIPLGEVLTQAKEMSVGPLMTIGTKGESNRSVVELVDQAPEIFGTLGIHPHEADATTEGDFKFIHESAESNPKIIAIGECGFDFFYSHSTATGQKEVFYKQIEIALELNLPLVIHARDAEAETMQMLKDFKGQGLKGVFHSFTSSLELAELVLEQGFYLSFNGIATFPKAENVREVLLKTPKDRILIETDSPFLAPKPFRGRTNFPGYVSYVGMQLAEILQIDITEFQRLTRTNTLNLFQNLKETV
ncbi:MAG: TatD family hydrolase [SAR324 cluster bacterium]|nr:TatD family hydrolase [SAR324 cluster bacterium]